MDRLTSMSVFVAAVERGGFAAAAEVFKVSPTMVGLHVRALEDKLGSRLLNRTTRRQSLTELGRLYYERCKTILAEVEAADACANALATAPRGRLRIASPVSFGVHALAPALPDYLLRYPEVEVDLVLNDRIGDMVEEGYEAVIRVGQLEDSSLIARPLRPYRMLVCASPAYLEKHGKPDTPDELTTHNCLGFAYWDRADEWRFDGPQGAVRVPVRGSLRANNGSALRMAARNGLGVVMQPEVLLAEDIDEGRLVRLLDGHAPPSRPMAIVYLPDRQATPKLRSFIDFVVERFGEE